MEELDLPTWTSWSPLSDSTNRLKGQIALYFFYFVLVYRSVAVGIGRHNPFFDCL